MNAILGFIQKLHDEWVDGRRLSPILKAVAAVLSGILIICVISWGLAQMIMYIALNIDWIVFTCLFGGISIAGIKSICKSQKVEEPAQTEDTSKEAIQLLETNYSILQRALFDVISTLYQVIKVKKPLTGRDLEGEQHYIRKGNIVLYPFIVYKIGELSTDLISTAITQEIDLSLKRQSFIGIGQQYYFYSGQPVSIIQLDSIEDCGTYYTIYLTIADENYCRYKQNKFSTNLLQSATGLKTPTDRDF